MSGRRRLAAVGVVFLTTLVACAGILGIADPSFTHEDGADGPTGSDGPETSSPQRDGDADGGPPDGAIDASRPPICPGCKIGFLSSAMRQGGFGGLQKADEVCMQAATDAGLSGAFVAWLSAPGTRAIDRLNGPGGPWYQNTDGGLRVFLDRSEIGSGMLPSAPITYDEHGALLVARLAWTGTIATGLGAPENCAGWSSSLGIDKGRCGQPSEPTKWTDAMLLFCNSDLSFICFQH
ncbi:hypothetical protein BH11MYX4_BH11MYX4_46270 [soil metagenome]